jgi:transposase
VLSLPGNVKVYVAPGTTDMRKSYDALEALTRTVLAKDPLSGHVFAFCGRRRDRVKLLFWDGSGFWLFAKRLARGTFAWPAPPSEGARSVELRGDELSAILSGIDLERSTWKTWWRGPTQPTPSPEAMVASSVSSETQMKP